MLSDLDRSRMQADLQAIRDDRAVSIVIRRNGANRAAQTVRLARAGMASTNLSDSGGVQSSLNRVTVLGDTTLDIQPGDKFTVNGTLYQVTAIHPHRDAATLAEAQAVQ